MSVNLSSIRKEDLEAELARRAAKFRVKIQNSLFDLTLEEVKALQVELNEINQQSDLLIVAKNTQKLREVGQVPYIHPPSSQGDPWSSPVQPDLNRPFCRTEGWKVIDLNACKNE